jgi:hypothetical protein
VAGFTTYFYATQTSTLSDEEQIQMLLLNGRNFIERKDIKGVMSCISKDYHDQYGRTYSSLKAEVFQALKTYDNYNVILEDTSTQILGNTASVRTKVTVLLSSQSNHVEPIFKGYIVLNLRKERTKRFLILPVNTWKVLSATGPPAPDLLVN